MNQIETGLEFNFTYGSGVTEEQILGVELAGEIWSHYLQDNHEFIQSATQYIEQTTVNLHIEIGSNLLPGNVIGGAFPAISDLYSYQQVYDALTGDITSQSDRLATDNLADSNQTDVLLNGQVISNNKMELTRANLKALDLIDPNSPDYQALDGRIILSDLSDFDSVEWNYDYLGGAKPDTLDFLTTITHEIGHTLGFISGVDGQSEQFNFFNFSQILGSANGNATGLNTAINNTVDNIFANVNNYLFNRLYTDKAVERMTSLDLFRYSTVSATLGANELTKGAASYFSLDGSATGLAMSTGKYYQGSHWQDREQSEGLGVMNPTVALNERWNITGNDLLAMDAIGWDINYSQPLDMQALYNEASTAVANAVITDDVRDAQNTTSDDGYDARRSRSYWMNADYYSTFSEATETTAESSAARVVIDFDRSIVDINQNTQPQSGSASETTASIDNIDVVEFNSPEEETVTSIDIENTAMESNLLEEILDNFSNLAKLWNGLEVAIATQTL